MLSLLALASSACWGTSDFFAGLFSRRRPAVDPETGLPSDVAASIVVVPHAVATADERRHPGDVPEPLFDEMPRFAPGLREPMITTGAQCWLAVLIEEGQLCLVAVGVVGGFRSRVSVL